MKVIIRANASVEIGTGHVMRCLTIAEQLRKRGCSISFYMQEVPGNMIEYVMNKGYRVVQKFEASDICIIDDYHIDSEWEKSIRPYVKKIIVIDDLADRTHECDMLIDQNLVPSYKTRYDELVPSYCLKLLGPKYLIVRNEFRRERRRLKRTFGNVRRILVFMGGTDPTNETMKILKALNNSEFQFEQIDVVVGKGNVEREHIKEVCKLNGYQYHCQIDYMATLMSSADFAIGAGGSTMWERAYLGLPSSSTIVALNQREATIEAARLGLTWNLGWHGEVTVETYEKLLEKLHSRKRNLLNMSEKGLALTGENDLNNMIDLILEGIK